MIDEGAAIIDVGGESTRPGATSVSVDEELQRVIPVIRALAKASPDVLISVDTTKAPVARAALEAGAHIVNDVSALQQDPDMAGVVRETGAGVVLMHMQGTPRTMQENPVYGDVTAEVIRHLADRCVWAEGQGIVPEQLAIDPGIGFGKTAEHNWILLEDLPLLARLGRPVLVGVSRKRFLGALCGREVDERLPASLAALVCAILNGAQIMRVHDVKESCDAALVADRMRRKENGHAGERSISST
jgi:dihydropteroate synthase